MAVGVRPHRIILWGSAGRFSESILRGLAEAGLAVVAVIEGAHSYPPGRSYALRAGQIARAPSKLAIAADEIGAPYFVSRKMRTPSLATKIADLRPDLHLSAGYPKRIPDEVLALSRHGGLNVHPGALPEERGPSPLFWRLKRGHRDLVVTIHVLATEVDAGDVLHRASVPCPDDAGLPEVYRHLAGLALRALPQLIADFIAGRAIMTPQTGHPGHCPRPRYRDAALEPTQSAAALHRFVRVFADSHRLFFESAGDRFFIEKTAGFDPTGRLPSEYLLMGDELWIQCKIGVLRLSLQADGALFSAEYT